MANASLWNQILGIGTLATVLNGCASNHESVSSATVFIPPLESTPKEPITPQCLTPWQADEIDRFENGREPGFRVASELREAWKALSQGPPSADRRVLRRALLAGMEASRFYLLRHDYFQEIARSCGSVKIWSLTLGHQGRLQRTEQGRPYVVAAAVFNELSDEERERVLLNIHYQGPGDDKPRLLGSRFLASLRFGGKGSFEAQTLFAHDQSTSLVAIDLPEEARRGDFFLMLEYKYDDRPIKAAVFEFKDGWTEPADADAVLPGEFQRPLDQKSRNSSTLK